MTWLSSDDLEYMRDCIESLLPGTAYLLSLTVGSDGYGGITETWGTAGTVACRIDSKTISEPTQGGAIQPQHGFVLTVPHDTTITEAYRVVVGSETYTVTSVDSDKSWNACIRKYLERVP